MNHVILYTITYLIGALLLTIAIEVLIAWLRFSDKSILKIVALAQCVTNPLVNVAMFITTNHALGLVTEVIIIAEILAVIIEAIIYHKTLDRKTMPHPLRFSLLANVTSFMLGLAIGAVLS